MPVYQNIGGTWTIVKHVWKNVGGTWTKVRKLFRNVGGTWTQYHGDNDFVAYSLGELQNEVTSGYQGMWVNGAQTFATARSYNLAFFDKYGNITFTRTYDIYGEAQNGSPSTTPYGSAQFASDVSGMAAGQLFILTTFDEPQSGNTVKTIATFQNAVLALGGTTGVFENAGFASRGAYMLLGAKGSGPTFEAYRGTLTTIGSDTGCLDGAIEISFNIVNGAYANLTRTL